MDDLHQGTEFPPGVVLQILPHHTARREFGDESVVLDLNQSVYFGLNRTAGLLWERLLVGATHDQLVDVMMADGAPERSVDQIRQDVDEFLGALQHQGLVHDLLA